MNEPDSTSGIPVSAEHSARAAARRPTKPTRADLLRVIEELQHLVGVGMAAAQNDRAPDRAAQIQGALKKAFDLCVAARSMDPPPRSMRKQNNHFPWMNHGKA